MAGHGRMAAIWIRLAAIPRGVGRENSLGTQQKNKIIKSPKNAGENTPKRKKEMGKKTMDEKKSNETSTTPDIYI